MYCRDGENNPSSFRSDRFCQINGMWYFVTREKTREGPFPSRSDATMGAERYLSRMRSNIPAQRPARSFF